jgi:hypothetical protein
VTEDFSRAEYDPANIEAHRVPPTVAPELEQPSAPPGKEGSVEPTAVFIREPGPAMVTGRMHDRPHFIRVVDGVELCGQCARPWPCPAFMEDHPEALVGTGAGGLVELADVAQVTGLTMEELRSRIGAQGGRVR